ncbi:hypothetical protein [uncultured Pigmentiphaga sp.]|jgi:hypothetical protein|uniref:hypothetical protein n=1 Tax=uncultured Pigmentiphaga sp. TaxID=340361 RepID=UPI00262EF805|nr:hypothetical protein [uncultured Pigmentiphaga sp.]
MKKSHTLMKIRQAYTAHEFVRLKKTTMNDYAKKSSNDFCVRPDHFVGRCVALDTQRNN